MPTISPPAPPIKHSLSFLICKVGIRITYLSGVFLWVSRIEPCLSLALFSSTHMSSFEIWINSSQNNSGLGVCGRGGVRGLVDGLELCRKVGAVTSIVSRGVWEAQPQNCPGRAGLGESKVMPTTLLTREVMKRITETIRERLQEHRKRRDRGNFFGANKTAYLHERGNHKIDHCVNSYIIYQFSNTGEISKKRKGRRPYITRNQAINNESTSYSQGLSVSNWLWLELADISKNNKTEATVTFCE